MVKNFLNASMFEKSDKREAFMQKIMDEVDIEKLSPRDINLILN